MGCGHHWVERLPSPPPPPLMSACTVHFCTMCTVETAQVNQNIQPPSPIMFVPPSHRTLFKRFKSINHSTTTTYHVSVPLFTRRTLSKQVKSKKTELDAL